MNHDISTAKDTDDPERAKANTGRERIANNRHGKPDDNATRDQQENPDYSPNNVLYSFPMRAWHWIREKWTNPYRHRANVAEIVTAFLTVAIVVVGVLQWRVYRQQKGIMESSGRQTQQLIDAAHIQACAARKIAAASVRNADAAASFSISASGINTQTAQAVAQLERQANEAVTATTNAKKALDASIENSRTDQRAWLGLQTVQIDMSFKKDGLEINGIRFPIRNTGRTPALQVSGNCIILFRSWNDRTPDYDVEISTPQMQDELRQRTDTTPAKGSTLALYRTGDIPETLLEMDKRNQIVSPQDEAIFEIGGIVGNRPRINHLETTLYLIGEFTYLDIFSNKPRHTKFCLVQADTPNGKETVAPCNGHNSMD